MPESMELIDLMKRARTLSGKYENVIISRNNNHVLRMSRMTEPYFWHFHPNSDETFIGLDGTLILELENQRLELGPGQVFTVLKGSMHRTSPCGSWSVNLTVERADIETVRVERPGV